MTEHTLMSENRESLEVTAVTDVTRSLRITQLDLDTGRAALSGEIVSLTYMRGTSESGGGLLKKLMR